MNKITREKKDENINIYNVNKGEGQQKMMKEKSRPKSKNMAIDRRTRKNKALGATGTFERALL